MMPGSKSMVPLAGVSIRACRSDPAPASLVLVTVNCPTATEGIAHNAAAASSSRVVRGRGQLPRGQLTEGLWARP